LSGIRLVAALIDASHHIFTDRQLDAILSPCIAKARSAVVFETVGYDELETNERVNVTLNQCLSSHFGFRRQLSLFVRWTFSSSQRDAARQVSTPSAFAAWLGISILQPSPNLSGFQLIVAD
jgi:hypothetical protein